MNGVDNGNIGTTSLIIAGSTTGLHKNGIMEELLVEWWRLS